MSRFAQGMKTRYAGAILNISSRYPDMYAGVIMIFRHFHEVYLQVPFSIFRHFPKVSRQSMLAQCSLFRPFPKVPRQVIFDGVIIDIFPFSPRYPDRVCWRNFRYFAISPRYPDLLCRRNFCFFAISPKVLRFVILAQFSPFPKVSRHNMLAQF